MADLALNVNKIYNLPLDKFPERYPSENIGVAVIEKLFELEDFVLYRTDHGKPNSEELRNIDTGKVKAKDFREIDVKNDYFAIHKQTKFLFSTGNLSIKTLENLLQQSISYNIQIKEFFSQKDLIYKLQELNEVIFYVQPDANTSLFSEQDELNRALKNLTFLDPSNQNAQEISLSIKYNSLSLNRDRQEKLKKYLDDLNYTNVSIKASWMSDRFSSFINANEVTTKIQLQGVVREKGRITKESLSASLSNFFKSEDFKKLQEGMNA